MDKPFYRYIMGTMSDFHHYLQKFPFALGSYLFGRSGPRVRSGKNSKEMHGYCAIFSMQAAELPSKNFHQLRSVNVHWRFVFLRRETYYFFKRVVPVGTWNDYYTFYP